MDTIINQTQEVKEVKENKDETTSTEVKDTTNTTNTQPEEPKGEPISKYVKSEVANQLIEMGYSKNVAEKACFFNNNIVEKAIEWCYEHQDDPDFEKEERIASEAEKP